MPPSERNRTLIILAFILQIISGAVLFIGVWNNLVMNPQVLRGNGLLLLVLLMLVLSAAMLVLHLMEEKKGTIPETVHPVDPLPGKKEDSAKEASTAYAPPFEVDIDLLAESIVPRLDPKESLEDYAERILNNIAKHYEFVQGMLYMKNSRTAVFEALCSYAYTFEGELPSFRLGDGIPGQVAKNRSLLNLKNIPEGYMRIQSGLGEAAPLNLLVIPLLLNRETIGIIELASFQEITEEWEWTFNNLAKIIGNALITKSKAGK